MRTSRQVAEKLGTVRQDPDLNGLLFILIIRATGGRQERAAQLCLHLETWKGRGLSTSKVRLLYLLTTCHSLLTVCHSPPYRTTESHVRAFVHIRRQPRRVQSDRYVLRIRRTPPTVAKHTSSPVQRAEGEARSGELFRNQPKVLCAAACG